LPARARAATLAAMPASAFTATIVTYHSDAALLERSLASLGTAIVRARERGLLSQARVFVVDNGDEPDAAWLRRAVGAIPAQAAMVEVIRGHGNVGYGRANNLVLGRLDSEFHLVMNPDVELDREALAEAIAAMQADAAIGIVAPFATGAAGERQFLCKRYPSVWVLFLRGFAPSFVRARFAAALDHYEMRDLGADRPCAPIPLASGCFMLVRSAQFRRLGGFDPRFFMYFEDYDLSLRVGRESKVAYVPQARIVHHGGEASRKGWRHVLWFLASARRFFATHGWRIA
jgi:GT2 family glycosyltransferase